NAIYLTDGSTQKRENAETEHAQRVPDAESAQQMRMRERQRFFEEVFQHDVDVYLSSAHLQIDYKRPPLGSISSMEVNVDMLEQMDLMDISDQEALDVFFSASGEEGSLTSSLPGTYSKSIKSRMLSTSSSSTCDSQASNEDGSNTPIVQSDDEDVHEDSLLRTGASTANNATKEQSALSL
uniref:Dysbindin-like n=1 Tax=Sinocyclocheilus anshuiensis TaxID=1608454 RepID=A0A671NYB9_9TELE